MFSKLIFSSLLKSRSIVMFRPINGLNFCHFITNYNNNYNNINKSLISRLYSNEKSISIIEENVNNSDLNDLINDNLTDFKPIDALDKQIDVQYLDDLSPALNKSFNLSAFANKSQTLQLLIKLGVDLSQIERKNIKAAELLLSLDFDKDIKPYILFLTDNGLNSADLGFFITKNPLIFKEHLDDLEVRINYLRSKRFTKAMIALVITKAPKFLSCETKFIDLKLGFLQKEYHLTGDEVRHLVTSYPRIALLHSMHLRVSLIESNLPVLTV